MRNHTKSTFHSSLLLPDQVKNIMFAQQFLFQNNAEYLHLSPPAVSEVHQLHVHSADALDRNPQSWLQVAACSAATFKFQLRPFRAHKVACTSPAKSSSLDHFDIYDILLPAFPLYSILCILSAFERRPLLVTGVSAARPFPGLGAVIPAPSPWTSQIWKCN